MAGKKRHWVRGHWRNAPKKKAGGSGWGVPLLVVGAVAFAVWKFRG